MFDKIIQQAKALRETLDNMEVTGESGAGSIKVIMNGQYQVRQILIEEALYSEGKTVVSELIASATNVASLKVKEAIKEKMKQLTGGFGIPADLSSLL